MNTVNVTNDVPVGRWNMTQKLRQTVVTWVVVYPVITSLLLLLEPMVGHWALPLRTLLLTAIMAPLMVLWAMPFATGLLQRFLTGSAAATPPRGA